MAIYQVDANGNAPKNAKAGDTIVTQGGSYEVGDNTGKTHEQMLAAGYGYNPSSGLYSKKVSTITTKDLALQNYNTADRWLEQANTSAKNELISNFNTNVSNAMQTYNTNLSGLKQQANTVNQNYDDSVREAKTNAYYSGLASMEGAANRGMANSSQSQAAANSALYAAGSDMVQLNSERNTLLNDIYTNINTLTQNYNIQLDELEKNRLADELSSLSNNQLQYLATVMGIDEYNADAYNNYRNLQTEMEWQSAEAQKDREHDKAMLALQNYYSNGGSGGSSGTSGADSDKEKLTYQLETMLLNKSDGLDATQVEHLSRLIEGIRLGYYTEEDFWRTYNDYIGDKTTTTKSNTNIGSIYTMPYDTGRSPYDFSRGTSNSSILDILDKGLKTWIK